MKNSKGRFLFFAFTVTTGISASAASYDLAAYVWPAYQPESRWAELGIFKAGKGEWQNVWEARPKWPGHVQPLVPLWGYENEADPKVVVTKTTPSGPKRRSGDLRRPVRILA